MDQILESKLSSLSDGLPERYKIIGALGHGGMGAVFHAMDVQLQREVAIKFLIFEGNEDSSLQERFLKEAKTLASLNHPNIVRFFTSGISANGVPFHVMEFLQGPSLAEEMKNHPQQVRGNLPRIATQLLSALEHAHNHEIAHRDLKPSNIILCHDENGDLNVKLIDFGIARQLDADAGKTLTRSSAILGSPGYMSPEQCMGQRGDKRSDIYSFACVLHEIISGKPVFEGETGIQIMYKQMNEDIAKLQLNGKGDGDKSSELSEIIDACLQRDPSKRPSSADEISRRLIQLSEHEWKGLELAQVQNSGLGAAKSLLLKVWIPVFVLLLFCAILFFCAPKPLNDSMRIEKATILSPARDQKAAIEHAKASLKFALHDYAATKKNDDEFGDKVDSVLYSYNRLIKVQVNSGNVSDLAAADATCAQQIAFCVKEKNKQGELRALVTRADLALRRKSLKDAELYFGMAAKIVNSRNDHRKLELQDLIIHRTNYYLVADKFDEALAGLDEVHQIWKSHQDSPNIAVNHDQTIDPNGPDRIELFLQVVDNFRVISDRTFKNASESEKTAILKLYRVFIQLCMDTSSHTEGAELAKEAQIKEAAVEGHDDTKRELKAVILKLFEK